MATLPTDFGVRHAAVPFKPFGEAKDSAAVITPVDGKTPIDQLLNNPVQTVGHDAVVATVDHQVIVPGPVSVVPDISDLSAGTKTPHQDLNSDNQSPPAQPQADQDLSPAVPQPTTDDNSNVDDDSATLKMDTLHRGHIYQPFNDGVSFSGAPDTGAVKQFSSLDPIALGANFKAIGEFDPLKPFNYDNIGTGNTDDNNQHLNQALLSQTKFLPPIANPDTLTIASGQTSGTVNTLTNDQDPSNTTLTPQIVSQGEKGVAVVNSDKTITYTENAGQYGHDTVITRDTGSDGSTSNWTTLTTTNTPPTPQSSSVMTNEGHSVTVTPPALAGTNLTIGVVNQPANGVVTVSNDGQSYTYTPNKDFHGNDPFTIIYKSPDNVQSSPTTETAMVNSVAPTANPDNVTTSQDTPVTYNPQNNDINSADTTLTTEIKTAPTHGTAVVDSDGKEITYTPNAGWYGTDTFTIDDKGSDGNISNTVQETITVNQVMTAPPVAADYTTTTTENDGFNDKSVTVSVQGNNTGTFTTIIDSGPATGTATVDNQGNIVDTPDKFSTNTNTITYHLVDSEGRISNEGHITIAISPHDTSFVSMNDDAGSGFTALYQYSTDTNSFVKLGASDTNYNCLAYDPISGKFFAIDTNNDHLINIALNGQTTDLGAIQGFSIEHMNNAPESGAFDSNGVYYVGKADMINAIQVHGVDQPTQVQQYTVPNGFGADIVFDSATNNLVTTVQSDDGSFATNTYSLDGSGNAALVSSVKTDLPSSVTGVGGLFTDSNPNDLYEATNGDNSVYLENRQTGEVTLINSGGITGQPLDATSILASQASHTVTVG